MNQERTDAMVALAGALGNAHQKGIVMESANDNIVRVEAEGELWALRVEYPDGDNIPEVMVDQIR